MAIGSGYSRRFVRVASVVALPVVGALLLAACSGQDDAVINLSSGSGPGTPADAPTPSAVATVVPQAHHVRHHRAAAAATVTATTSSTAAGGSTGASGVPASDPGWKTDFLDEFNGTSLNTKLWGTYNGKPANNSISSWSSDMVSVGGGSLNLRSQLVNGSWVTGGVSSARAGAYTYGRWTFRYKVQKAAGVAYVVLLYPQHGWPPEYDIAEDGSGGDRSQAMSTLHWGAANTQQHAFLKADFSRWTTVTETSSPGLSTIAVNGTTQVTMKNAAGVPSVPMWLGIQTQVNRCSSSSSACVSSSTPSSVALQVDYVAHQSYVG